MKQLFSSIFRQFLFWIFFFAIARMVFIAFCFNEIAISGASATEILKTFVHALKLDAATTGYFLVVPFLLLCFQAFFNRNFVHTINQVYTGLMIFLYASITAGEIGLYGEWKSKLTIKALKYLQHPAEVYNSADSAMFFTLIILVIALVVLMLWLYRKFFYYRWSQRRVHWLSFFVFVLLTPPVLLVIVRGGFQPIPINQSQVYFSDKIILNHIATNNAFNLYISIFENLKNLDKNPYTIFSDEDARRTVENIYSIEKDTTIKILMAERPNVVLLLLESWSADLIESLGGEPGITPEFRKLEKEGILFDNMLSSGARSEQGMAAVFSGFPAHPVTSITVQPDKFLSLPSLVHELNKQGYHSSFYFGGQLIYGNIKSYIYYNGFHRILEGKDFDDSVLRGKLGVHDEFTLTRLLDDLNNEKQPFFSVLFTLSSHSPYDQPMENVFDWGQNENGYINSAFYTDKCLGDFFEKARKAPWFDSTLFILVADHSHNSYRNHPFHSAEYHRIPMLFYGSVIKNEFRGTRFSPPGSQVDISATLLKQLDLPTQQFHWSRNLLNPYSPDFKYFGFDNGLIWIETKGGFSFDLDQQFFYWNTTTEPAGEQIISNGKSYLQVLYQEYLDY